MTIPVRESKMSRENKGGTLSGIMLIIQNENILMLFLYSANFGETFNRVFVFYNFNVKSSVKIP